jgi:hypothetical protein
MTGRHVRLLLILSLGACTAAPLLAGLLNCSFMTDFDKPLVLPDERMCLRDSDCWSDDEPEHDCDLCDTELHQCVPEGPDADRDGYHVCERAIEEGTSDCDDEDDRIHPYHIEEADLLDNDCSGVIDDQGALVADPDGPEEIDKPVGCADPCLWSNPRMVWNRPHIDVIWQSEEGHNADLLRVAELNINGSSSLAEQRLVSHPGSDLYGMFQPGIARLSEVHDTPCGAVWVDELGMDDIHFLGFDFNETDARGIPREQQEWPLANDDLIGVHEEAEGPVIVDGYGQAHFFVAWTGRDMASSRPKDVFVGKYVYVEVETDVWAWRIDDEHFGADNGGRLNISQTTIENETGRPGFVQAGSGWVIAWVVEAKDAIRIAHVPGAEPSAPVPADIRTVPLPGLSASVDHPIRDLVAVRRASDVTHELVYLVFCAPPDGETMHEVWTVSVSLDEFEGGADDAVFGAPLRLSQSPGAPSVESSAAWHTDALAVVWSEHRGGHNHVYFRRVAELESSHSTSGVLASDEIDMGLNATEAGVYGQSPAIVATDMAADDVDFVFAVMWSQRRSAGGDDTGELYLRLVEPAR